MSRRQHARLRDLLSIRGGVPAVNTAAGQIDHDIAAVNLDLPIAEGCAIPANDAPRPNVRTTAQRFYEGVIGFNFPMLFSGIADVREWYDDDAQCFRIAVDVHNSVWGPLFGYRSSFTSNGGR
jgi:hypothetical protein